MPDNNAHRVGLVRSLWRYPVKSMRGEPLEAIDVEENGLSGDRAYGLVDRADGKVATAKNPRKWPNLFSFRASLAEPAARAAPPSALRITLPDGRTVSGDQRDVDQVLSTALGRQVRLAAAGISGGPGTSTSEQYWPDIEGRERRDAVADFQLQAGTFFDCARINLLTTATLRRFGESHPSGRFEVARFRPNIVVEPEGTASGFVENDWVGRTVAIGDQVRLKITGPCGRCVMTTLPQEDLPQDLDILRTVVRHNGGRAGVYASVVGTGRIIRGDVVRLDPA